MAPSLGKVGNDAYNAVRGGLTHDGKPIPAWNELPEGIRAAWEASAQAVAEHVQEQTEQQARRDAAGILQAAAARYGQLDPEMQVLRDLAAEFGVPALGPELPTEGDLDIDLEPALKVPVSLAATEVNDDGNEYTVTRLTIALWTRGRVIPLMFDSPLELMLFAEQQCLHLDYDAGAAEFCRGLLDLGSLLPPAPLASTQA